MRRRCDRRDDAIGRVAGATAGSALIPLQALDWSAAWRAGIGDRLGGACVVGHRALGDFVSDGLRRAHCSPSPVVFVCLLT
jgi:hypothetical protein